MASVEQPVQSHAHIHAHHLPSLSDGFTIPLDGNEWGALFPRYHLMWVSPDFERVKNFVRLGKSGSLEYADLLSAAMKQSFEKHYREPLVCHGTQNLFPQGEVLDSTICFLPTNDCNLGCKYCFAGAEPKKFGAIPWEIAKAGVDLGTRNALLNRLQTGSGKLTVRFFGGGEPTEYWDSFAKIVEYARESAAKSNLDIMVATLTNGQVDEEHFEWFKKNIDEVTVSIDGPPDIQNEQRPTFAGETSFDKSWKFLLAMSRMNVDLKALRVTVTAQTVGRMAEIANFFWDNLPKAYPLQFEPVYFSEVGRQNATMPKAADFVEQFRLVEELVELRHSKRQRHALVGTATRPLALRAGAYCDSLEGRGLFITPNGYLTLCTEVSVPSDPRKDNYFIGKYDFDAKQFQVGEEGKSKVRCGTPWWCRGCYAQFSCKGGCEPRSQNPNKYVRKWWCQMVRSNLRHMWADVRTAKVPARARIGDPHGEELIWLPVWDVSTSMD